MGQSGKDKGGKDKGVSAEEKKINPSEVMAEMRENMRNAVEKFSEEIRKIKTGRAHPSLLEGIKVFAYDSEIPLNQLAIISVVSPSELTIEPYDPNIVSAIEKAILQSGRDLVPSTDGKIIRIKIPPLTQETREKLVKMVRKKAEDFKVSLRNIRDDARSKIKSAKESKIISEDQMRKLFTEIDKETENHTKKIEEILSAKEKEIMGE
jgi:ribosome recycling factor